ncbi:MAG: LolA family protein, partial [Planctomycetota bacterium]
MKSPRQIKQLAKKIRIKPDAVVDERVLTRAETALAKSTEDQAAVLPRRPSIRRTIMKSPITKFAAAAVIIITVVFVMTLFEKAAAPAYALEQTIEANHTIKTVHLRKFEKGQSIGHDEHSDYWLKYSDYWLKYDDAGKLSNLRCNEHAKDGIKFTVWNEGIEKNWIPQDNVVIVKRLNNTAKKWEEFAKESDYELLLQWLNDQAKEDIELKIDEPAEDSDSIYVEATHSPSKTRVELVVDRKTKLIKKLSRYNLIEHGDELDLQVEFFAYNQPIAPSMFELKGIPDNAKVIERVEGGIIVPGLRVGDYTFGMSKDEVLKKCGEPEYINFGAEGYTLDNPPGQYGMRF